MPIVQTPPISSVQMARNIYDVDANNEVDTVQAFSWADLIQKPKAFPPIIPHGLNGEPKISHNISEIKGLSDALATYVTVNSLPIALAKYTYTSTQIDALLATKAPVTHFHDNRYYLKPYIDQVTSPSGIDSSLAVYQQSHPLQHNHDDRYYDKAYVDDVFNISNISLVNDARYYTKPEVDQEIANAPFLTQPAAELEFYDKGYIDAALATLGDGLYVFSQATPSSTWSIDHELKRYPTVNIYVSGELALAKVVYPDSDHISIYFTNPQIGSAYLT